MSRQPTSQDYEVLGLPPGAGEQEVRDAYRRLAKLHHPDRNPGDPAALDTFRRLTDSYAALRNRRTTVRPGTTTPLSAQARRSAAPPAGPETRLGDLAAGGALWVSAEAVLAGPDRVAALVPTALGTAFPSGERVIRVERHREGFHVFMPPQPSARWGIGTVAETAGLGVAALWVGDRQDGPTGSPSAARLPLRLVGGTIGEMGTGDHGWVAQEALAVDPEGSWTLDLAEPVCAEPHRATPVRVSRQGDGFHVRSAIGASVWAPEAVVTPAPRGLVVEAVLAGLPVALPAPPP